MPVGTSGGVSRRPVRALAGEIRPMLLRLDQASRRDDSRFVLSRAKTSILCTLAEHGGLRISELARFEGVRVPTVSNAIRALEESGMVTRTADHSDRRVVTVRLTEHGRASVTRVLSERDADLELRLQLLDEAQRRELLAALPALRTLVAVYSDDSPGR